MNKEMLSFEKPPLSISEQITLLQDRGLTIEDLEQCQVALTYIGYYRLSGYMIPFYDAPRERHVFGKNSQFHEILNHYKFDQRLRLLCISAIEKIEVSFRTIVSDYMSLYTKNPHWYDNQDYFKDLAYHGKLLLELREKSLRKPKEKFIDHYHKKYAHPELPPSWMLFETFSFGDISFLFKNLKNQYKKEIALYFGQDDKILSSWIHSLCYLRNLCAHHSRVWNREMSIVPKIAKHYKSIQTAGKNQYFFGLAVIIKIILDKLDSGNRWFSELEGLAKSFPNVNIEQVGFPESFTEGFPDINLL